MAPPMESPEIVAPRDLGARPPAGHVGAAPDDIRRVVNREAGGDFDTEDFEHVAFFNGMASQIEMHLEARRDLRVRLEGFDMELDIRRAERIRTEISRKFTRDSAAALLAGSGFTPRHWFCSDDGYFALALATAAQSGHS